jgi:hypothetical protein
VLPEREIAVFGGLDGQPVAFAEVTGEDLPGQRILDHALDSPLRDAILVGHSMGGFVATAVSERAAKRIAYLVFLDAPVPRSGETAW